MPTTTLNDVTINYREIGNPNNPTLVLAHTVLWGAEPYNPLIAALQQDFHIIDTDLHGHGTSGYRTPLTLEEMAADYYHLITQAGLTNVTWIGNSLGSLLGLQLAVTYPDLFDRLILIVPAARIKASPLSAQTQQLWDQFRAGARKDVVNAAMPLFFAQATMQQQPQLVEAYRQKAIAMQDVEGIYQTAMISLTPVDLMDQLADIRAKTLVIAGREDITAPPEEVEQLAARIPNAALMIFEEASHLVLVEKSEEVISLIQCFLTQECAQA